VRSMVSWRICARRSRIFARASISAAPLYTVVVGDSGRFCDGRGRDAYASRGRAEGKKSDGDMVWGVWDGSLVEVRNARGARGVRGPANFHGFGCGHRRFDESAHFPHQGSGAALGGDGDMRLFSNHGTGGRKESLAFVFVSSVTQHNPAQSGPPLRPFAPCISGARELLACLGPPWRLRCLSVEPADELTQEGRWVGAQAKT
jgi:hypothetical protein